MTVTAEQRKTDLVDRLATEARKRVDAKLADSIEQFIRRYFALVAPDDIIYTPMETLLGGALCLWEFGEERQAGTPKVRLFNPTVEKNGWTLEHTVIEIVNDDMPFLVDSVTAELGRRERNVHLLLHPIVNLKRDKKGKRLEVVDKDAVVESYMHIEIDQETEPAELDAIRKSLEEVLADVRMAVADFDPMRKRLSADVKEMETVKVLPKSDVDESREFLRWLDDGNYIFLGFRRYDFMTKDGKNYLTPVTDSGLGILRTLTPESAQRGKAPLSKEWLDYAEQKDLLILTKTNRRSTIHKNTPMDRIGIKRYDAKGNLIGEDRYLGLFTSAAYNRSVSDIPMLRLKAKRAIEKSGLDLHSHNGKALLDILETFPRDEFFQITDSDLFEITRGILLLQERQRVALFTRKDTFERFISCYVFVPRDRYTPDFRERAAAILEKAFQGRETQVFDHVTDSALARGLFVVRTTPGKVPEPDIRQVETQLAEAAHTWSDRLLDALTQNRGEEHGIDLHRRYKKAFPMAYAERFSSAAALYDIEHVEEVLAHGGLVVDLYRHRTDEREFHVKIIHAGEPVALSELMPRLENMGVKVQSEVPYEVCPLGGPHAVRIRDFSLSAEGLQDDLSAVKKKFEEAFVRVWRKEAENDAFNKLVLLAELAWDEVVILRAYCKYLRQIGVPLSEAYIQQTMANNPAIARDLVALFKTQFDPSGDAHGRDVKALEIRGRIDVALDKVTTPDEDRILRLYLNAIESSLRTNYFQPGPNGERKPYLSFKLDSQKVKDLPLPRPLREIFVYAPFVEGIHLRGGKVARGGIRWSDRREDFRTEILGLMKAQNVKNVVIVPMGSKGGFVVKNPSADRATYQKEGIECYKTLLRGLLDITDNLRGDDVIPPANVVRRDGDDPYLVVAADKGTATFSDIANSVSADYGFWLGDAFASGGSAGYDHKEMGITARGAWEAVKRHFREMGIDTQTQDFTCVGVGDMSGDVFGNGMLLSEHIRMIAVFNHSHIFVDPNPDPKKSFAERRRMFDERLNWNHYNASVISKGGAVFERTAKTVTVSDEVQALFELPQKTLAPADLIRAILCAKADLLWLGGIGTYVKASWEDNSAARDRGNDILRISADELRVKVVGEGANLGFTQQGRIEFGLRGGRLNTDAIDNSAGVDTSDHEVNIKILLYDAIARGELSGIKDRNALLATMTDEVGTLVLRDNYEQTQAISITQSLGEGVLDEQARFMRGLERAGRLNRAVEGLPDDETIVGRHAARIGLTRPEISVLLAYSKIVLSEDLLASDLPDDPLLVQDLLLYFPQKLRKDFPAAIGRHRLRREIISTYVTNNMINRVRPTFVWVASEETGKPPVDVARAFTIIRDAFDLRTLWQGIEALDNKLAASVQIDMMTAVQRMMERAILWLLRSSYEKLDIAAYVSEFRPRITVIEQHLDALLPASVQTAMKSREDRLIDGGIPRDLARRIAGLDVMSSAMDIVRIARADKVQAASNIEDVARVYFGVGARFGLDRLRIAGAAIAAETPWQKAAVAAVVDDLFNYQSVLASRVITEGNGASKTAEAVDRWLEPRKRVVDRVDQTMNDMRTAQQVDLAMLSVAVHQLRTLVES